MRSLGVRMVAGACLLAVVVVPVPAPAQGQDDTAAAPAAGTSVPYSPQELDQLLSPIALYPDPLLSQILMAATYPLEVVMAARWVRDPDHAGLKDDALTAALAQQDWSPSVKALVPFPQILQMMDGRLEWTEKLGNAFLAQQADVMDSVQRLRRLARAAGHLPSTAEQAITTEGRTIVIQPASPSVVYVPVYDPAIVYAPWPYPAYPPLFFPPPPGLYVGPPVLPGFSFTVGIFTVAPLWGWQHLEWHRHRIVIDPHRYNIIDTHHPPVHRDIWEHERLHRRGVPYPTPGLNSRFRPLPPHTAEGRELRGYPPVRKTPPPPQPPRQARPERNARPLPITPRIQPVPPQTRAPRTQPAPPRVPPAFQGLGSGEQVQREERRGRDSLQTMPAPLRPQGLSDQNTQRRSSGPGTGRPAPGTARPAQPPGRIGPGAAAPGGQPLGGGPK